VVIFIGGRSSLLTSVDYLLWQVLL